ncbi:WD40 repeat-like protein [Gonapodya prolifera JEL478]|uniref:WD40 repeat-like protein n=1 Tax=Gonapodya prolifera (strain JEL478) TaxID=1344416 RepID=A0A139AKD6_GONPJ|nr:WD40 repeat-like protein [Gonapodya prolifera JEL478]|eukprot:KXS17004.1 WD40 repeat-like protein [Gonapodya prolifera JEL478]
MNTVTKFDAQHDDLIHDIAYDYYGKRMATCASDHRIKVWDMDDTGKWILNDSWKAHDGSVLRVSFSHPEHFSLLASCSLDRTARIWEENEAEPRGSGRRWTSRAVLGDGRGVAQAVAFAPNWSGLKLATVSSDSRLRLYEALDPSNPAQWTMVDDVPFSSSTPSPSPASTPSRDVDSPYTLSWSTSRFYPAQLVVGCGKENVARILRRDPITNRWSSAEVLAGAADAILDVAWAPNVGRSYHLIATASRDHHVRIYKLTPEHSSSSAPGTPSEEQTSAPNNSRRTSSAVTASPKGPLKYRAELVMDDASHSAEVWRCAWNVTGTSLATSGEDGRVRVWKASFLEEWKCVSVVGAEVPLESMQGDAY